MSDDEILKDEIIPCKLCGHPVVERFTLSGASYYLPVPDSVLEKLNDDVQTKKIKS